MGGRLCQGLGQGGGLGWGAGCALGDPPLSARGFLGCGPGCVLAGLGRCRVRAGRC